MSLSVTTRTLYAQTIYVRQKQGTQHVTTRCPKLRTKGT